MSLLGHLITVRLTHIALITIGIFFGFSLNFLFETHMHWTVINRKPHSRDTSPNATANQLYKDVKVLCWIMTCPSSHRQKAVHIMRTWGKRCNKLLFMSTAKGQSVDLHRLIIMVRKCCFR